MDEISQWDEGWLAHEGVCDVLVAAFRDDHSEHVPPYRPRSMALSLISRLSGRPQHHHILLRPEVRRLLVEEGLYDKVLNRCVEEGKMCMHHMMAIDSLGGEAYMRAAGLNLPQDVCTAQNAAQVVAALETRNAPAPTSGAGIRQ